MPASFVAWRWASLKYAGTVMTASVTFSPRYLRGVVGQLAQDQRRDLLRRVLLAADLEAHRVVRALDDLVGDDLRLLVDLAPLAPDEALGRVDRRLGVEDRLALGDLADEPLPVLGERDHGRRRRGAPSAFGMTSAWPPSIVAATTELVVPRSMPTALAMFALLLGSL